MYSYYIPIWICIFLSLFIYIAVGYHVFHHRNQLKNITFTSSEQQDKSERDKKGSSRDSAEEVRMIQFLTIASVVVVV